MVFILIVEPLTSSVPSTESWEFAKLVHMFCGLGEGIEMCPLWHPVGGALGGHLLKAVCSLFNQNRSLLNIVSSKPDLFPVNVGLQILSLLCSLFLRT